VTLDNKIKCLSLAVFFFWGQKATNETVTGTAYIWGILTSKPPGPFIMIDQSEILNCSYVQFITLFFGDAQTVLSFSQHSKLQEFGAEKAIP
jgi:hypothetical protein